ncbi:MAG: hypothetical protein ACOC5U_02555 [Candidatus Aminicenantaceae bacterium]
MQKKSKILFLLVILSVFSFACKDKAEIKGVDLEVDFSEEPLSDNLITDMEFKWITTSEFEGMNQDRHIFVHFWHDDNLLFQADYVPDVPTSEWQADREYVFNQRIYIPEFIDEFDPSFRGEETLKLVVGMFSPYDRTGKSKQEVLDKRLKVYPPPLDAPEVLYEDGWYPLEMDPESYLQQWRWTQQEASCIIDNPHRDAMLVIRGGINKEAVPDQKVTFRINDQILDEFVPESTHFEKSYNIKESMPGEGDEFRLVISVDKTFVPAELFPDSTDERELGAQISFIYFR